ncbi:hypothetical protein [Nocardia farcinica]|uniref:hypothetical protein n=1 Tax=Nocardia farcinica TaxID=37329 RepID=UPI002455F4C8|nr:hypothetical protein [Nocardia farcinica]
MTAPATGTPAPADPGTTEPTAPLVSTPNAEPATGTGDGDLGESGLAALKAERKARAAAEKAQAALEAKVKAFEDAQKTEAERTAERIAALEKDAAKALRYEAAEKAELPLSLAARLNGSTLEELIADAGQLKQLMGINAPDTPAPAPTPKPDRRQGGGETNAGGSMTAGRDLYRQRKRT